LEPEPEEGLELTGVFDGFLGEEPPLIRG